MRASDRDAGKLPGVRGVQDVAEVTLIRHAYVLTAHQDTTYTIYPVG